ncbi:hypothetical protein [Streptomyces sp. NPDC051211]|uniref:hypothetical protein n=1 Tax=Streptomyces sp. NPDC051211 TaxID=3154643 RepID=UPI00344DD7D5
MTARTRARLCHAASTALGAALLAGFLPGSGATAAAADAAATGPSEAQLALKKAKSSGVAVEVLGKRTEYATTYANPDGVTFRVDRSITPVRAKNAAGTWVKADPALELRSDGRLAPKGSILGLSFSNGGPGSGMLKTEPVPGYSLAMGWPGKLPKPVVSGDSATYTNVFPGVDLRLTAASDAFRYGLIIKSPEAAANPAVRKVRFSLATQNLWISGDAATGWTATPRSTSRVQLRAGAALMWDSKGTGTSPNGSSFEGPADGDTFRPASVVPADDSLTLVPDAGLLAQTSPSAYPLYVFPEVTTGRTDRVLVRSDGYHSHAWGNGADNRGKGAGATGSRVERLYFQFRPWAASDQEILDAQFKVTRTWAAQCEARPLQLIRVGGEVGRRTTWERQPEYLDRMGDQMAGAASGAACDSGPSTGTVTFKDNPAEPDENLTETVRVFARGSFSQLTLELRAEDETDTSAWKSFRNNAVLSVTYVDKPDAPTSVGIARGTSALCSTRESAPTVVGSSKPTFTATVQAKEGEEHGARLRAGFLVQRKQRESTYTLWPDVGSEVQAPASGYVGDGTRVTSAPSAPLAEGVVYRVGAASLSLPTDTLVGRSSYRIYCYFTVDLTAPKAPTVKFNGPYGECTSASCPSSGGPGQPGSFAFGPASGDTNTRYMYKLSTSSTWTEVAGAKPTVTITPPSSGTVRLSVRAKDSVGRWGAEKTVDFVVAP